MNNFCNICPNKCNVLRTEKNLGRCGAERDIKIAKYYLHPFEEPIISGSKGSGAIFFTGCPLKCVFCQNYELSRNIRGKTISPKELADIYKRLEDMGAHNINLVTPSHYTDKIIESFEIYKPQIPVVYNTHSYESLETLKTIDKYVDIYLPDLKFYNGEISKRYTGLFNYFEHASKSIEFMMNSKKTVIDNGIMKSGVIVRHLVLPLSSNDSIDIINWFAKNKKNNAYISIMSQYTPFGKIENFPELNRKITKKEYTRVLNALYDSGIENYFLQELSSSDTKFIPTWDF